MGGSTVRWWRHTKKMEKSRVRGRRTELLVGSTVQIGPPSIFISWSRADGGRGWRRNDQKMARRRRHRAIRLGVSKRSGVVRRCLWPRSDYPGSELHRGAFAVHGGRRKREIRRATVKGKGFGVKRERVEKREKGKKIVSLVYSLEFKTRC